MDNAKGYKAFNPGMICKDKQYAENTDYEEVGGKICEKGMMHYCVNPFDVLNFYDLVDESGKFSDFAEVKALDQPASGSDGKFATKKLHIGAKLSFAGFIKACIDYTKEQTIVNMPKSDVTTGDYAQIGNSGNCAQIGSSGNFAKIGSSGNFAQIGSSGDCAKIGSSGNSAQIGSSGYSTKIGSSGDCAKIDSTGVDSVVCCAGHGCTVKAKIGSWITLAEWEYSEEKGRSVPRCVKTEYVDGEKIKPDTWYQLKNGEFVEVNR
nr:MAG TPA: hypothetical protein [Caudoviricetes sp.]